MKNINEVQKIIESCIDNDSIKLPTPPDLYIKIAAAADCSDIQEIESIIKYNNMLSAKILRVANSAAFNISGTPIASLSKAITRLGTNIVQSIVLSQSLKEYLNFDSRLKQLAHATWKESILAGAGSFILCKEFKNEFGLKYDMSLTCGIVHNIGKLPILAWLNDNEVELDTDQLSFIINSLHPILGTKISVSWNLPIEVQSCMIAGFDRTLSKDAAYVDVLEIVKACLLDHPVAMLEAVENKIGLTKDSAHIVLKEYEKELNTLTASFGIL